MHAAKKRGHPGLDRARRHELVQRADRHARELADVDEEVTAAGDVGVDDVHARPVLESGVLQSFGGIELAMRARRVVEESSERAHDVLVVVEDLVVESTRPRVPLHEDRVWHVDLDLPNVLIGQQRSERPVSAEVAERPVDHALGVGDAEGSQPALVVEVPPLDFVFDDRAQAFAGVFVHTEALGALLHPTLDLSER